MFIFDYISKEDIKVHNPNWPEIPDYLYRMLIIGSSGSGKANSLLNLINNEPDIDKIYSHGKYPHEAKYQLLINKRESTGLKYLNDSKPFIKCSNDSIFIKILKIIIQIIRLLICLVIKNLVL